MDQDIFYDATKLSHSEKNALLRKAHSICEEWRFDKLDCRKSWARQPVEDVSFDDAMGHFVENAFMVVIHR